MIIDGETRLSFAFSSMPIVLHKVHMPGYYKAKFCHLFIHSDAKKNTYSSLNMEIQMFLVIHEFVVEFHGMEDGFQHHGKIKQLPV